MIAMTTRSSINVKAFLLVNIEIVSKNDLMITHDLTDHGGKTNTSSNVSQLSKINSTDGHFVSSRRKLSIIFPIAAPRIP